MGFQQNYLRVSDLVLAAAENRTICNPLEIERRDNCSTAAGRTPSMPLRRAWPING